MDKNWNYYGVFFDNVEKQNILGYTKNYYGIPKDWKIYCDHMTLVYNNNTEERQKKAEHYNQFIGKQITLIFDAIGISDDAIALRVSNCASQNKISHVTVATRPGVKPVESNNIKNWLTLPKLESSIGTINVRLKTIK